MSNNTESILNSYKYESLPSVKRVIRQLLRLEERAIKGNEAAMILIADIKDSIGLYNNGTSVLTERQRYVIIECLVNDRTELSVSKDLGVTQQNIQVVLDSGIKRIQKHLLGLPIPMNKFSEIETVDVISLYNSGCKPKQIAITLNMKLKTVQNKIKVLKKTGKLEYKDRRSSGR